MDNRSRLSIIFALVAAIGMSGCGGDPESSGSTPVATGNAAAGESASPSSTVPEPGTIEAFEIAITDESASAFEVVHLGGGTFTMGSPVEVGTPEYHPNEAPLEVSITPYAIGRTPVTASQFCAFLNDLPNDVDRVRYYNARPIGSNSYTTIVLSGTTYMPAEDAKDAPANQVTWLGAVKYCEWLSEKTSRRFRLPSEAEWEFAARGAEGRVWPWGEDEPTEKFGWRWQYSFDRAQPWTRVGVGSFKKNETPEGVQDILAYRIGEWCVNMYVPYPSADEATNTHAVEDRHGLPRAVRGYHRRQKEGPRQGAAPGEWHHEGRPWSRVGELPLRAPQTAARFGFRVAVEPGIYTPESTEEIVTDSGATIELEAIDVSGLEEAPPE